MRYIAHSEEALTNLPLAGQRWFESFCAGLKRALR